MKSFYTAVTSLILTAAALGANAQACTPQGDQTTYGANNVWRGYVYQGKNFDTYKGYVTEGTAANPNFDESFGGDQVNYNTNGCQIYTDNFSVRYKLTQNFTAGNYQIVVGGDDGYRLSLDGGATWPISNYVDHGYTTTTLTVALSGSTNMVIEFYENGGANRISFNLTAICTGTGDPSVYGTNNVWAGYLYQGMNFQMYKGQMPEGSASSPNFDESFGNTAGSNTATYNTNSCSITTYQFSARYRLTRTFAPAKYTFMVGGDDGFRLSLDGGNTWVINKWNDQSYTVTSYTATLNGTYNMVLEYYQNGGSDRISFNMTSTTLPITLVSWAAKAVAADETQLQWQTTNAIDFDHFTVQRSTDAAEFHDVYQEAVAAGYGNDVHSYSYNDHIAYNGSLYYRLAMVDRDGTTKYSNIVSVSLQNTANVKIYPTVTTTGSIYIDPGKSVASAKLEIFNMSGARVSEKSWSLLEGRQQVSIAGSHTGNLPAGAYIARLTDGHSVLAKQVIILQ